jgi:hypothetical protein
MIHSDSLTPACRRLSRLVPSKASRFSVAPGETTSDRGESRSESRSSTVTFQVVHSDRARARPVSLAPTMMTCFRGALWETMVSGSIFSQRRARCHQLCAVGNALTSNPQPLFRSHYLGSAGSSCLAG